MSICRWVNAAFWAMVFVSAALASLSFWVGVWPSGINWTIAAAVWAWNALDDLDDDYLDDDNLDDDAEYQP